MKIENKAEEPKQPAQADSDSATETEPETAAQIIEAIMANLAKEYPHLVIVNQPKKNS